MSITQKKKRFLGLAGFALGVAMLAAGCGGDSADREQRIRDEAAKAAAEAKPKLEEAGRAVKAAVDGAKEGWENGHKDKIDLNAATEEQLTELPGIGKHEARRIILGRPYHDGHDLLRKKIVTESEYAKLKDDVTAK